MLPSAIALHFDELKNCRLHFRNASQIVRFDSVRFRGC